MKKTFVYIIFSFLLFLTGYFLGKNEIITSLHTEKYTEKTEDIFVFIEMQNFNILLSGGGPEIKLVDKRIKLELETDPSSSLMFKNDNTRLEKQTFATTVLRMLIEEETKKTSFYGTCDKSKMITVVINEKSENYTIHCLPETPKNTVNLKLNKTKFAQFTQLINEIKILYNLK